MKVPPFRPGPATGGEYMTKAGAERLAAKIREAWAKCGHDVTAVPVLTMTRIRQDESIYTVAMPTLINGLPR